MPVGEGSIKRAAGKAEGGGKKTEADMEVRSEQKTAKRKGGSEPAVGTENEPKTKDLTIGAEKASGRKTKDPEMKTKTAAGRKKPVRANVKTENAAAANVKIDNVKTDNAETENVNSENGYEAYGIGQPLPTYLL